MPHYLWLNRAVWHFHCSLYQGATPFISENRSRSKWNVKLL